MKIPENLISQAELARMWGMTPTGVMLIRKRCGLPFFKAGRKIYYDREEAEAWYRDNRLLRRVEAKSKKSA